MSVIKGSLGAHVTKTVFVEFDADNRPEYEDRGKTYQIVSAQLSYAWRDGVWVAAWEHQIERSQKLKSGEWGEPRRVALYHSVKNELEREYAPTSTIEIKEIA